jgi:hypothetical protein
LITKLPDSLASWKPYSESQFNKYNYYYIRPPQDLFSGCRYSISQLTAARHVKRSEGMDPLSLTAGIAGLIKVCALLSQTVVSIMKDVKDYPKEFNALVESASQMSELIWKIGPTIRAHKGEASGPPLWKSTNGN